MEPSGVSEAESDELPWLGRRMARAWQYVIWVAVLGIAIANPGITNGILFSVDAFVWFKYLNTVMLVALLAGVLLVAAYGASRRNWLLALRWTSVVTLIVFLWPGFSRLDVLPSVLGPMVVVLVPTLIIWVVAKHGDRSRVAGLMVLFAFALLVASTVRVADRSVSDPPIVSFPASDDAVEPQYPDVLFILLDGYGRDDVLEEMYGFDNTSFLSELESLGFSINGSASANYNRTYATVASMMDLGYPIEAGLASVEQNGVVRGLLGQRGSLVNAFSEAGYEVTYSENAWGGSRCGDWIDYCWRSGTTSMSAYGLALLSPFAPLAKRYFMHPMSTVSFGQLTDLSAVYNDRADRDRPQFVWSHFILPHPPLRLDRSCDAGSDPWRNSLTMTRGDSDDELRRAAYIEQMVCVNTTLVGQLDDILRENPETAIFIFGDHGPDGSGQLSTLPSDLSPSQIRERLSVLLAVREPSGCFEGSSSNTLVTAARDFTSCTLGLDLDSIPERRFLVPFRALGVPAIEIPSETER